MMGGKKEIYQYIRFFHGALQLFSEADSAVIFCRVSEVFSVVQYVQEVKWLVLNSAVCCCCSRISFTLFIVSHTLVYVYKYFMRLQNMCVCACVLSVHLCGCISVLYVANGNMCTYFSAAQQRNMNCALLECCLLLF